MDILRQSRSLSWADARKPNNAGKKMLAETTGIFEDCPPWMQGDPLIRRGYRKAHNSFKHCLRSLFFLHNESINTWSHLLAGACFLVLVIDSHYAIPRGIEIPLADKNMVLLYNLGTVGCLFSSALFHMSNSHSEHVAKRLLKLDYLGVMLTISTTNVSATYFGLVDHRRMQSGYLSIQVLCAATVSWVMMSPRMDGPQVASLRSLVFALLSLSGIVPILHVLIQYGFQGLQDFSMPHVIATCLTYATGMIVYNARMPEKSWPGMFDIWVRIFHQQKLDAPGNIGYFNLYGQGASHQIFHILASISQLVHLLGLRTVLVRRYTITE